MSYVYFIRPIGMDGPVKVGCSDTPEMRLQAFTPNCPFPLEIVVQIEGPRSLEHRFHALFLDYHLHHEWFAHSPLMYDVINKLRAGTFDLDALPFPIRLGRCGPFRAYRKVKAASFVSAAA